MKNNRIILAAIALGSSVTLLSSCALARSMERELNIVFMHKGNIIGNGSVTQYKNIKSPVLDSAYIPTDYKFLGWTPYALEDIDLTDVQTFKSQYISSGRMVHYMEAKPFADNSTVTYQALLLHKDDIPKEYHYAVVAWYDKEATSGITAAQMEYVENQTRTYLAGQGVSEEDLNTLVFRGYSGNVGQSTGQIIYDNDVDIMFGWGSKSNITTTGTIPSEIIEESNEDFKVDYNGATKTRTIHRISPSETGKIVYDYLNSPEILSYFHKEQGEN